MTDITGTRHLETGLALRKKILVSSYDNWPKWPGYTIPDPGMWMKGIMQLVPVLERSVI
jgi:hypothetical protein